MASINQFKSLVNAKNGIARSNLFRVKLPSLPGATMEELNVLCKDVQLPGRQVLTNDRRIGMQLEKVPYGYAVTDISFTFHVLNDYGVKEYFETWQNLAVNQNTYEVGYQRGPSGYARQVEIEQFKKVMSLPPRHTSSSSNKGIFPNIGSVLNDTEIVQNFYGLADELSDMTVYKVKLIDAYPTTMNAVQLNNELDGVTELNISMSYTNWETPFIRSPSNIKDAIRSKISTSIVGFINDAF